MTYLRINYHKIVVEDKYINIFDKDIDIDKLIDKQSITPAGPIMNVKVNYETNSNFKNEILFPIMSYGNINNYQVVLPV